MKRAAAAAPQVYQDFDPPSDSVSDDNTNTLLVYLPGNLSYHSLTFLVCVVLMLTAKIFSHFVSQHRPKYTYDP